MKQFRIFFMGHYSTKLYTKEIAHRKARQLKEIFKEQEDKIYVIEEVRLAGGRTA